MTMPVVISIVGRSQTGKTTLIEKLIPVFKQKGYRVGTIKHSHHVFDIDKSGKDSYRHKEAGADTVILASPGKIAMVKNDHSGNLENLVDYFKDMDLLITEGYKREARPKIEVVRSARHSESLCRDDQNLVAIVTDVDLNIDIPIFGFDDHKKLVEFIENKFLKE